MEKLLEFINSIDFILAAVMLLGGRIISGYHFARLKSRRTKFLLFSLIMGALYIAATVLDGGTFVGRATNFLITFLFVNTFYQLLFKRLFEYVESVFPKLAGPAYRDGEDDDDGGPGSNPTNPPPPPPGP
jgi:hypothetical protein